MKTLKELQFGRTDIQTGNRHLFVAAKDLHNDYHRTEGNSGNCCPWSSHLFTVSCS